MFYFDALAAEGSFTWNAWTVTPSITIKAVPSNYTGATPEVHGVTDIVDSGDASWAENYHVQLRISTNPSLDQPEGEGGTGEVSLNSTEESSPQVQTVEQENWMEVGRGRDYLTYRNSATGEYKQVIYPGPIHTWDGSEWVGYVFENKGDYYQVQHPIASARFYPDRTEFWDENFENRVVVAESWAVERPNGEGWQGVDFSWATISHEILSEDEVRIVRTENSVLGILKVTYIFTKGSPLKITSEFTASENVVVRFSWRPEVEGAVSHRIAKEFIGW